MIREAEVTLEGARGNALENVVLLAVVALPARNRQAVLVNRYGDLLRRKAREGQRDPIALVAGSAMS